MKGDFSSADTVAGIAVFAGGAKPAPTTVTVQPSNVLGSMASLNNGGHSGNFFNGHITDSMALRVIVDRSAVEAYAQGGRGVATKRAYPAADQTAVNLINTGKTTVVMTVDCYPMAVANPPTVESLLP